MIIKLQKIKDVSHAGYMFKEIVGTKADGDVYTKRVIVGDKYKAVLDALDDFGTGDFMNLSYDDSKFRNVESVKPADGFPKSTYKGGGNKGKSNYKKDDGTTRGDDTNRSASIYLAQNIMGAWNEDEHVIDNYLAQLMYVSTRVFEYIRDGKIVLPAGAPEDVLEPPIMEE